MELIAKVKDALGLLGMSAPAYELTADANGNVSGFVSDPIFAELSDDEAQQKIWEQLRATLSPEDQRRVLAIFQETPAERSQRQTGFVGPGPTRVHFFCHTDRERARYWLFVDVTRVDIEYKAMFFLFSAKSDFFKSVTFVYSDEVIEFMELTDEDIYPELHRNAFGNGEAELKAVLMNKYDKLEALGKVGENNPYWYVFNNFVMAPCPVHTLRFDVAEVSFLEARQQVLEPYSIWVELAKAITRSRHQNTVPGMP